VVLSPSVAAGLRQAGEARIPAPPAVRARMARDGTRRLLGSLKLCLDSRGRVAAVTVLRSTGHAEYDEALRDGMRRWRYSPYTVDGRATPACTVVTVVYVQE
jgi:TonB family protein